MKFLKYILALLSIIFCLGEVYAQSSDFYADRIVVAQRRVNGRSVYDGTSVQPEKRQRRFATPANNTAYQERANRHQNGQPAIDDKKNGNKSTRMTKDERRALRQQINDANQGIYKKKRNRASNP